MILLSHFPSQVVYVIMRLRGDNISESAKCWRCFLPKELGKVVWMELEPLVCTSPGTVLTLQFT